VRYEGGWTTLGSGGSGALDIAVPPGPVAAYAWAVNGLPNNQLQMHLFDQQFAYPGPPGLNAPAVTQWWTTPFLSTSGATVSVAAAGQNGQPWIVDGTGKIFRSTIQ